MKTLRDENKKEKKSGTEEPEEKKIKSNKNVRNEE